MNVLPAAINIHREVVGREWGPPTRAFVLTRGHMRQLRPPQGLPDDAASSLNDSGTILATAWRTGRGQQVGRRMYVVVRNAGSWTWTWLRAPAGFFAADARGIAANGDVVGDGWAPRGRMLRAVVWVPTYDHRYGLALPLPTREGLASTGIAISSQGDVTVVAGQQYLPGSGTVFTSLWISTRTGPFRQWALSGGLLPVALGGRGQQLYMAGTSVGPGFDEVLTQIRSIRISRDGRPFVGNPRWVGTGLDTDYVTAISTDGGGRSVGVGGVVAPRPEALEYHGVAPSELSKLASRGFRGRLIEAEGLNGRGDIIASGPAAGRTRGYLLGACALSPSGQAEGVAGRIICEHTVCGRWADAATTRHVVGYGRQVMPRRTLNPKFARSYGNSTFAIRVAAPGPNPESWWLHTPRQSARVFQTVDSRPRDARQALHRGLVPAQRAGSLARDSPLRQVDPIPVEGDREHVRTGARQNGAQTGLRTILRQAEKATSAACARGLGADGA